MSNKLSATILLHPQGARGIDGDGPTRRYHAGQRGHDREEQDRRSEGFQRPFVCSLSVSLPSSPEEP